MLADLRPAGAPGRPLAQLAELLGVERRGPGDPLTLSGVTVSGVTHDSRRVRPGDLFCCLPGRLDDGHRHAPEAVARGAVALLAEHAVDGGGAGAVPQAIVAPGTARSAMASVAAVIHSLVGGMSWAEAFALQGIDAAAPGDGPEPTR